MHREKSLEAIKEYRKNIRFKNTMEKIEKQIDQDAKNGEFTTCVDIRTTYEKLTFQNPPNSLIANVATDYFRDRKVNGSGYNYRYNCFAVRWGDGYYHKDRTRDLFCEYI